MVSHVQIPNMNSRLVKEKHAQWLKYLVYALLALNTVLFLRDEWQASNHLFSGSVPLWELISAFTATIDTASWVLLLVLFELETYQIPDEKWVPPLSTTVHVVRIVCYVFITYSFYGYLTDALEIQEYVQTGLTQACELASGGYSMRMGVDDFILLSTDNCAQYSGVDLFRFADTQILATPERLSDVRWLLWVDVINSFTWIMVVLVLEADVRLQDKNMLRGGILLVSTSIKTVLYATLFLAAVYWGFEGDFLDFWDAFLWLVAFVFIEMNVIQWNEELAENA